MKRWRSIHYWIDLTVTAVALLVAFAFATSIWGPDGDEAAAPAATEQTSSLAVAIVVTLVVALSLLAGYAYAERGFKKRYGPRAPSARIAADERG